MIKSFLAKQVYTLSKVQTFRNDYFDLTAISEFKKEVILKDFYYIGNYNSYNFYYNTQEKDAIYKGLKGNKNIEEIVQDLEDNLIDIE